MKKTILSIAFGLLFIGCEDFMDTKNFTKQDDNSFPLTIEEANQLIVGVYNTLNEEISDYGKAAFFFNELASDERFGGGGTDNFNWQAISKLLNFGPDLTLGYWQNRYQGIFRANVALEKFEKIPWANDKQKNTAFGEVHFFRGYYYFTLVQFFENVPLITESLSGNVSQAPVDDVFAQAAFDLKKAIELLPGDPYSKFEKGRITKWAAQSIMARMFLFYTGFYKKSEMPLAGGGTITKAQVVSWLEDCIANSEHDLVSDYRNLWPYTNQYTVEHYHYTKGKGLKWAGESNKEVVLRQKVQMVQDLEMDYVLHSRCVDPMERLISLSPLPGDMAVDLSVRLWLNNGNNWSQQTCAFWPLFGMPMNIPANISGVAIIRQKKPDTGKRNIWV